MTQLPITQIITDDPAFYLRDLNAEAVSRYAEDIERLPPIEVWQENGQTYLVDGRHRLEAHRQRARDEIAVVYFEGSRPEAEARARTANLTHALPLTAAQRRQARIEILERLYEYSNNWLAEDYMACSSNTVTALREALEEAGRIPRLDRLKGRDGSMQPRAHRKEGEDSEAQPDDGLFGAERDIKPPDELMKSEEKPDNKDGGYNVEGDEPGDSVKDSGPTRKDNQSASSGGDRDAPPTTRAAPRNTALKLAQVGEALAVEVILYVDDEARAIPVTVLVAEGMASGVEEAAPGHNNVLVLTRPMAEALGLIFN